MTQESRVNLGALSSREKVSKRGNNALNHMLHAHTMMTVFRGYRLSRRYLLFNLGTNPFPVIVNDGPTSVFLRQLSIKTKEVE